jgi:serine protease AprX
VTELLPVQSTRKLRLLAIFVAIAAIGVYAPAGHPPLVATINQAVATYLQEHPVGAVSVIVETNGDPAPVMQLVQQSGGRIDSRMTVLSGFTATINPGLVDRLNHDSRIRRISINAPVRWEGAVDSSNLLNRYDGMSRVPAVAWNTKALDGASSQVAVIDTGVWPHDDLVGNSSQVPGNQGNRLVSLYTNPLATDPLDHYGHGTHVAGIIAGSGYDSNGKYIGVAPNSMIVSVKVSDDLGNANEGDVISGLEWVYQANQHGMKIRVVNLSVASTVAQSYHQDPLDAMVEKLWFSGVAVVTAAGNGTGSVLYAPGNDPFVITVGSIDDLYQTSLAASPMADWSRYGYTQDGYAKPEVVADGSHVVSLLAPASLLAVQHTGNIVDNNYFKMGGTSMAAPEVAGMVALMIEADPSLGNNRIKKMLRNATVPFGTTAYTSWLGTTGGFLDASAIGRVVDSDDNANQAISMSLNPNTGAILAGGAAWGDAQWVNASWTNASWTNASWTNASWTNASWTGLGTSTPSLTSLVWNPASWANTSWINVNPVQLANGSWTNASWTNGSWTNGSWTNGSWTNASWTNTPPQNASWTNASWTNGSWTNASWTGIQWSGISFDSSSWTNGSWTNGSWTNGSWTNASWTGSTYR